MTQKVDFQETMAETSLPTGELSLVPIGDALAVKDDFTLESVVATLGKLDGRDKATKVRLRSLHIII